MVGNENQPERAGAALFARRAVWGAAIAFWAALAATSYAWQYRRLESTAYEMAALRGRLAFDMIAMARSWNSRHGTLYAPVTAHTPPNPYLEIPEKIVATPSGRALTVVNPAYMTRQMSELLALNTDLRIHLTSLKPINPNNAPDPWERTALEGFEAGGKEAVTIDERTFRYMAPLPVKTECLRCHEKQGYKVGEVRGGLSVTQPAGYIAGTINAHRRSLLTIHGAAFLLLSAVSLAGLKLNRRHVLSLARERDQRRQTAETLARKLEELEETRDELVRSEKMASLGRMVAGFAHEVNTPVGIAVGAASHMREATDAIRALLAQEEVREEDLLERLDAIDEGANLALANLNRAAQLVRGFKRTSIDLGSDACRDFSMAELIEDVLASLHHAFKRDPIRIEVECPADLKPHGPAGAVEQILTNLLLNSRLHAFDEGRRAGAVRIAAEACEGSVLLRYRDDGAGMEPAVAARVFEPFFTTRHARGGSGLGLYIVYNLATQTLAGTIACQSAPGSGTRFELRFPMRIEATRPHPPKDIA